MSTFTPMPGGAPLVRQVRAQAGMEARLILRNGEQLLLAVVIPVIVLIGTVTGAKHLGFHLTHPAVDVFAPGVLALAVMSTSFASLAIATGFERRYGVIKRLGSSPLPRSGLLLGKIGALLMVEVLQLVVIGGVAFALGWAPVVDGASVGAALLVIACGTSAFAGLGLFLAGVLRAEATLAAANLVYLLLMAGGAVVLPTSSYGAFGNVATWLPSGALGNGLRSAFLDGTLNLHAVAVLVVWAIVGAVLTARTFTRERRGDAVRDGGRPAKAYAAIAAAATTQTVAIVDAFDDPNALADLNVFNVFNAQYALPAETATTFRKVAQDGSTTLPTPDAWWAGEIGLDLDAVRGLCRLRRRLRSSGTWLCAWDTPTEVTPRDRWSP